MYKALAVGVRRQTAVEIVWYRQGIYKALAIDVRRQTAVEIVWYRQGIYKALAFYRSQMLVETVCYSNG
jgi:uncharacterized protein (DUF2164 family)